MLEVAVHICCIWSHPASDAPPPAGSGSNGGLGTTLVGDDGGGRGEEGLSHLGSNLMTSSAPLCLVLAEDRGPL